MLACLCVLFVREGSTNLSEVQSSCFRAVIVTEVFLPADVLLLEESLVVLLVYG